MSVFTIYCTWQMQAVTNRTQSRLKYYKFGNVTGHILLQWGVYLLFSAVFSDLEAATLSLLLCGSCMDFKTLKRLELSVF